MGSLEVFIVGLKGNMKCIYKKSGVTSDDPKFWKEVTVDLNVNKGKPYWIIFKATKGLGFNSDIAIDDIIITEGHRKEPTCESITNVVFYLHTPSNLDQTYEDEK